MADKPNVLVAVVFYALYALGLMIFAVAAQAGGPCWGRTISAAALF